MKLYSSLLVVIVYSLLCVHTSSAYEYNFQITHGPASTGGGASGGPYEPQARSSVHFRGPQPHSTPAAVTAVTGPVYKDEQAYASEGYHGYSSTDKAVGPQFAVPQPDSKYRYAVEGDEPQTEIRYVSQEEAAKYHQYQANPEHAIKYVPAEEAHKYHQQAASQTEKYQGYLPADQQKYEAPQPQKYQAYQPAPHAEKFQAYQPAPAAQKYQTYETPQQEKYEPYQASPQTYQAAARPEKYQSYQVDSQAIKYREYQPSQLQRYRPTGTAQKVQFINQDQQLQYATAVQPEENVQYVPQFVGQPGHEVQPSQGYSQTANAFEKQPSPYSQPVAYQYAPEAKTHKGSDSKFEYPSSDNVQYVDQSPYASKSQVAESSSSTYPAGQRVKFGFPATNYEQNGDYSKSRKTHGVAQSASVTQPVAHKYASPAHPELTQVAAHGASAYGSAYTGNAHPGYVHSGYAHPGYTHQPGVAVEYAPVHGVHAEPQVHGSHLTALQAYHIRNAAGEIHNQDHLPVHKTASQHSFPDHLAHDISRGTSQTSHTQKVHDYYDEKSAAKKSSSKKKKSS